MKETWPSLKEYSRTYDKIIIKAVKNEFIKMIHIGTGAFVVTTIFRVLFEQRDFLDDLIGYVFSWVFAAAITIFPSILIMIMPLIFFRYSNSKRFLDIETLKRARRKLIRDTAKKTFFALLGIIYHNMFGLFSFFYF